jgi:hypothetical protein
MNEQTASLSLTKHVIGAKRHTGSAHALVNLLRYRQRILRFLLFFFFYGFGSKMQLPENSNGIKP